MTSFRGRIACIQGDSVRPTFGIVYNPSSLHWATFVVHLHAQPSIISFPERNIHMRYFITSIQRLVSSLILCWHSLFVKFGQPYIKLTYDSLDFIYTCMPCSAWYTIIVPWWDTMHNIIAIHSTKLIVASPHFTAICGPHCSNAVNIRGL